jgi:hypothetical protein
MDWMTEQSGFSSQRGQRFFCSSHCPDRLGVKRSGHKAGHSSLSSADVKNNRAVTPLLHISSWNDAWLSAETTVLDHVGASTPRRCSYCQYRMALISLQLLLCGHLTTHMLFLSVSDSILITRQARNWALTYWGHL